MKSYWGKIFDQFLRESHREMRISLTPAPKKKKWIFVVGCYNSGTTLLAKLLSSHPDVSGLPDEGQYFTRELPGEAQFCLDRMWTRREDLFRLTELDTGPDPARIQKEWAMRLDRRKPFFLEKTPANCSRMRWLQKHFENAHFIAIIRNPYGVCEGISRKARPYHSPEGWPMELIVNQWRRANEVIEEDAKFLKKFKWVRYEDLAENTDETLREIFLFLGLPNREIANPSTKWNIHGESQEIINMNNLSFENLTNSQIKLINLSINSEELSKFGYQRIIRD